MRENVKNFLYLGLMFLFIGILFLTILSFYYVGDSQRVPFYLSFFLEYHVFFMFFIAIFGIVFGSITQVMTYRRIESNQKKFEVLKKHFKNSLDSDEGKILSYLIQNKGVCTQYELTSLQSLNKLKVSRLLVEMEKKKLIYKERIGKINKVFLDEDLLLIFSK